MRCPAYPKYKPSNVQWLGHVPEHWEVTRLKTAATYWVSSVDKVASDEELPVRLCNYTDVYYNDHIRPNIGLMETTATADEIRRFNLRPNDVVITKDSEEWSDIAIPALVVESAPDLVCGYHLAIVRPNQRTLLGRFLLRSFQSCAVNQQFQIAATGVTRYGLPNSSIGEALIPLPTPAEQRAIADFLDAETTKLDTLIAKKRELIEKLKEKRTALISRTVTRGLPPEAARAAGLNPNPKLKPSGIEWLGEIPQHWETPPLYTRYRIELGKMLDESRITGNHLVPYLRNVDVQWDAINTSDLPEMDIREDEYSRYTLSAGDLLVCEGGEAGRAAIFQPFSSILGFQKALHRLRAIDSDDLPRFLYYTLYRASHFGIFLAEGNPNTIPHLTGEKLRRYRFPKPPLSEQHAIADYLDRETGKIAQMVAKVEAAIERLQEYRTALITAAVTGKIDVRTKL
jgi:type I restriction enzyme S subunit